MKKLKRLTAVISASVLSVVCMVNSMPHYSASTLSQKFTWRMVEKASVSNLEWYDSKTTNEKNYTFGGVKQGSLAKGVFHSGYYINENKEGVLRCDFYADPAISGTGYLSRSTWYAPFNTTYFSLKYSYNVPDNNSIITPICVLVGDVGGGEYGKPDGKINASDTKIISEQILKAPNYTLEESQLIAADVNNNGEIDLQDAILLERFINGSLDKFPN